MSRRLMPQKSYEILSSKMKDRQLKPLHYLCGSKVATGFATLDSNLRLEIIGVDTPAPFRYSFAHVKVVLDDNIVFLGNDLGQAYVHFLSLFNRREAFYDGNIRGTCC